MKFYHNGVLVRTSKTHHYTHALKWQGSDKVRSCHGSLEAAKEAKRRMHSFYTFNNEEEKARWIRTVETELIIVELEAR